MKITPILGINGYKSKDGTYPIYIKVNIGNKRKLIPVEAKIKKDQWDEKAGRVKMDMHTNAQTINLKIIELTSSLEKNHLKGEGVEPGNKDDFYWWFDQRLNYTKEKHGTFNYKKLKSIKNKLQTFAPVLPVKAFDYEFILRYDTHLKSIGNSANTIADNMMRLGIIVEMIIGSGKLEAHKNPFKKYVAQTTRVKKNRVKMDVIDLLQTTDFSADDAKELAVNMYLYSFFNAGIRFGDLCRIKKENIIEGKLKYTMHKTTKERLIKQMPPALQIIDLYQENKEYIFDTRVNWSEIKKGMSAEQIRLEIKKEDESINARNTFYNKKLKEVCEEFELPKITFHTARHSFTDYVKQKKFKDKDFDVHLLKDLLGHSKVTTTEIYLQDFYEEESDQAMEDLFGKP